MGYVAHFNSPGRLVGSMKDELDLAVADIVANNTSIVIDVNSTLSSQILVDSFRRQQLSFIPKSTTLPIGSTYLHGVYGPTVALQTVNNRRAMYYLDSEWDQESINQRAFESAYPENKILSIGKKSSAFLLSILIDPMYEGFVYSFEYLKHNQLITTAGKTLNDIEFWMYYAEPLLVAHHWGGAIDYTNVAFNHADPDFTKDTVYVNLKVLTKFLSKPSVSTLAVPDNSNLLEFTQ
jgi:hypothetical protein